MEDESLEELCKHYEDLKFKYNAELEMLALEILRKRASDKDVPQ